MTRKQTSAKVSKLAAKYLAMDDEAFSALIIDWSDGDETLQKDIRTLAASCLSQDEEPRVFSTKPMPKNTAKTLKWPKLPEPFKPLSAFTKAERAKLLAGEVLIKSAEPRKPKP